VSGWATSGVGDADGPFGDVEGATDAAVPDDGDPLGPALGVETFGAAVVQAPTTTTKAARRPGSLDRTA